jgi:FMN-dependent NADH-azoreductase
MRNAKMGSRGKGVKTMSNILVINSSAANGDSVSRVLVADAVTKLLDVNADARITHRDLGENPPPHLIAQTLNGVRGSATTDTEFAARRLSDELIGELKAADTVVIGAPMYNFSVPTTLRAWFDHVIRAGVTFKYADGAVRGLLGGKRVIVIESRGGLYSEGPAQAVDFQEPYLRHLLGFIGITDVTFVHAEKIGYGPEARTASLEAAKAKISEVVGAKLAEAA